MTTTVDAAEIERFSAIAEEWWDPRGKFAPLHKLNPVRLEWIRDVLCRHFGRDPKADQPLKGLNIVDIGCGGGLLSEPLARMGATVLGIDAAERNVRVASLHAEQSGAQVEYRATTAEALAASGQKFDAVLALEIIEHVADVELFLQACTALMADKGIIVLSTINRTVKSYALAIVGAEYILRWLPRGTHTWSKFLKPSELAAGLRQQGVTVNEMAGIVYDPFHDRFQIKQSDLDVNYMLWAERSDVR